MFCLEIQGVSTFLKELHHEQRSGFWLSTLASVFREMERFAEQCSHVILSTATPRSTQFLIGGAPCLFLTLRTSVKCRRENLIEKEGPILPLLQKIVLD